MRKPFQGILNIWRFNWHYYLMAAILISVLMILPLLLPALPYVWVWIPILIISIPVIISSFVSMYVYDFSDVYAMKWLTAEPVKPAPEILNIHAGFDETSEIIISKLPQAKLTVADFYDAGKHTEVSIKRARKKYPPYRDTIRVKTNSLPFKDGSFDMVILFLAVHEIRNEAERIQFFTEVRRVLKNEGTIILVEHLRDLNNFLAYQVGFFHFHSKKTWLLNISAAQLKVDSCSKITPFISQFKISKYGNPS